MLYRATPRLLQLNPPPPPENDLGSSAGHANGIALDTVRWHCAGPDQAFWIIPPFPHSTVHRVHTVKPVWKPPFPRHSTAHEARYMVTPFLEPPPRGLAVDFES